VGVAVTIRDVARHAKVSVASVSRAINRADGLSAATRERILRAVRTLRYVPHGAARSLITRRTHTVGVLLPDLHGEFFSEFIRGVDRAARARGLHLLVSGSHDDALEAAVALRAMHGRVDGLLIMSPRADSGFIEANLPQGTPLVLINSRPSDASHPLFVVDNYGGAFAMVRHLLGRGHRRIAIIAGPDDNLEAQERLRGYRDALAQLRPGGEEMLLHGDFTEESGWRVGRQIAALADRPTAVFASNDMMAIGCMFALKEAGVAIPAEIAVTGFDDIPIARYLSPPLTSVRVRITELGTLALERLAAGIESPEKMAASVQTLRTDLVVRSSCGKVRSGLAVVGSGPRFDED
jgi:LacI family transcriptional regulator